MKKILIDIRELEKNKYSGIGRFLINILSSYDRFDNFKFILLGNQKTDFDKQEFKELEKVSFKENIPFFDEQIKISRIVKDIKPDMFFSPYYKYPVFSNVSVITCIFDLTYLLVEPYKSSLRNTFYIKNYIKFFTSKSDVIITSSNNTKKDILSFFNIDEDKIKVLYLPLGKAFYRRTGDEIKKVIDKYNISKKYILHTGNNSHHKNIKALYAAYKLLPAEIRNEYDLVLVGFYDKKNTYPEARVLNFLTDDELAALYSGCSLFVFPSLYEGFGYPPLEALASGADVLCSNKSCIPEIVGEYAEYFNPDDIKELVDKIIKNLSNFPKKQVPDLSKYSADTFIKNLNSILKSL
jgi:glycosyltransferase involved in cell wall biosynthesis